MAESAVASAEIIPFPTRTVEPDGKARLAEALASLQRALDEQREAVAAWRGAMGELRNNMQRLGGSLSAYQLELVKLNSKVGALNRTSRKLQDWAEQVGTRTPSA
jgi:chromosome segregation ATPase